MILFSHLHKFFNKYYCSFRNLVYLFQTGAPPLLIKLSLTNYYKNFTIKIKYNDARLNFIAAINNLKLSNDWFTGNIPHWSSFIDQYKLDSKVRYVLEIGSWEGLSSFFILSKMKNAHITCVDTWEGADEHRNHFNPEKSNLNIIETNFDYNLEIYKNRISKYKGTSISFFAKEHKKNFYDFIYIDGSHHSNDVLIDSIMCFEMLKVGGIMVFDDYLWRYYENINDNPAFAINNFLKFKKGHFKLVKVYYQLVIMKIS